MRFFFFGFVYHNDIIHENYVFVFVFKQDYGKTNVDEGLRLAHTVTALLLASQ